MKIKGKIGEKKMEIKIPLFKMFILNEICNDLFSSSSSEENKGAVKKDLQEHQTWNHTGNPYNPSPPIIKSRGEIERSWEGRTDWKWNLPEYQNEYPWFIIRWLIKKFKEKKRKKR